MGNSPQSTTAGFPDKFPPMQQLAIDMMTELGWVRPHQLSQRWAELNGRRKWGSSRIMFGTTSAGYQTFYKLEKIGVCKSRRFRDYEFEDFEYCLTDNFKIQIAAKLIQSFGSTANELTRALQKAARATRKLGMTIWKLTAGERYKLHRRAKRFGCVVHPRLHIININHQKFETLNARQRFVLDRLAEIGYSIQIEI